MAGIVTVAGNRSLEPARAGRRHSFWISRGLLLDLAIFGWYLFLTGLYLWPLIIGLDSLVPHSVRDPGFQATVLHDVSEHLLHLDFAHLYDASFYYPAHLTLAMADAQIGLQPIALPLHLAFGDALLVLNILVVLSFPVTAITGDALGRYMTHTRTGGLIVGTAFAFSAYRFEHIIHLQLLQSWTIALAYLGLEMTLREDRRRGPWLWAFAIVAAAGTSLNYLLILAITQPVYAAARIAVATERRVLGRRMLRLVGPGAVAAGLTAILLIPYVELRMQGYTRGLVDTFQYSARAVDYLIPAADSLALKWLYQLHPLTNGIDERELFPGAIIAAAAGFGLLAALFRFRRSRLRRAAPWLLVGAFAFLFSLGPYLWPDAHPPAPSPDGLIALPYKFLAGPLLLGSLRSPARFGIIVLLGIAVLGAMTIVRGLSRLPRGWPRRVVLVALAVGLAVEYSVNVPVATVPWGADLPPAYRYLGNQPPGPVAELPTIGLQSFYLLASTVDGHPRLNGFSGFAPNELAPYLKPVTAQNAAQWLGVARRLGARYLVVHAAAFDPSTLTAIEAARSSQSLTRLASFGQDRIYLFGPRGPSGSRGP